VFPHSEVRELRSALVPALTTQSNAGMREAMAQ
jgi:hypothetical protein